MLELKHTETEEIFSILTNETFPNTATLLKLIRDYDEGLYNHSLNVAVLSLETGFYCQIPTKQLYSLGRGALLHDIGKTWIPIQIINKEDTLAPEEDAITRMHPRFGVELLKDYLYTDEIAIIIVGGHHDYNKNKSYPRKSNNNPKSKVYFGSEKRRMLAEDENISTLLEIVCEADVIEANMAERPYKQSMNANTALAIAPHEFIKSPKYLREMRRYFL